MNEIAKSAIIRGNLEPLRTFKNVPEISGNHKYDHKYEFLKQEKKWFGVCVHTTGSGVAARARRLGQTVTDVAKWVYSQTWMSCPHYFIDWLGDIYQVTDESLVPPHCGVSEVSRDMMLDGSWIDHVSSEGLKYWNERWLSLGFKSPQHLFPSHSANYSYLGIEMIPQEHNSFGTNGSFNDKQYSSLKTLLEDISMRHSINLIQKNRLVGHEDLSPFKRWDHGGGWDPGYLRGVKTFYWERLQTINVPLDAGPRFI